MAHKVTKYFGCFKIKNCCQELLKIAQSGRTTKMIDTFKFELWKGNYGTHSIRNLTHPCHIVVHFLGVDNFYNKSIWKRFPQMKWLLLIDYGCFRDYLIKQCQTVQTLWRKIIWPPPPDPPIDKERFLVQFVWSGWHYSSNYPKWLHHSRQDVFGSMTSFASFIWLKTK